MDIGEFVRARLDEDAVVAGLEQSGGIECWDETERFLRHFTSVRMLRDVEAKRRIVDGITESWDPETAYITGTFTALDVLRLLALPYSAHPDYDPAWAPEVSSSPA